MTLSSDRRQGRPAPEAEPHRVELERRVLLHRLERWLELPMILLGFVWLALLIVELTSGLNEHLARLSSAIWIAFILDFVLRLAIAPRRGAYLRRNWLTAIALVLPALRILRFARVVRLLRAGRAARGLRLVRVLSSLNRGMKALGRSMSRRGLGYVLAATLLVTAVGAAGMYAFERGGPAGQGMPSYWSALWWTAMIMTSLGSEYWPRTPEGRLLGFLLSAYAVVVLGYITASLASFFIERDAESGQLRSGEPDAVRLLRREIEALREELRATRAAK